MADLLETIKTAAMDAYNNSNPMKVVYGTVTQTSPLIINVEQKITLTEEFLILTDAVRDHDIDMTVEHSTNITNMNADHTHEATTTGETTIINDVSHTLETDKPDTKITGKIKVDSKAETTTETTIQAATIPLSHSHAYTGRKTFRVHNGLKTGDKVIMIAIQGGQEFLVVSRC